MLMFDVRYFLLKLPLQPHLKDLRIVIPDQGPVPVGVLIIEN